MVGWLQAVLFWSGLEPWFADIMFVKKDLNWKTTGFLQNFEDTGLLFQKPRFMRLKFQNFRSPESRLVFEEPENLEQRV